jgi:hypothetical protein
MNFLQKINSFKKFRKEIKKNILSELIESIFILKIKINFKYHLLP